MGERTDGAPDRSSHSNGRWEFIDPFPTAFSKWNIFLDSEHLNCQVGGDGDAVRDDDDDDDDKDDDDDDDEMRVMITSLTKKIMSNTTPKTY